MRRNPPPVSSHLSLPPGLPPQPKAPKNLTSPPAKRLEAPKWPSWRSLIGAFLIITGGIIGWATFEKLDSSTLMWAARNSIVAGTRLSETNVELVKVSLQEQASHYLPQTENPVGQTLTRNISGGELIARDFLGKQPCGELMSIPVENDFLPEKIHKGDWVDIYAHVGEEEDQQNQRILTAARVDSIAQGGAGKSKIIVRVPSAVVPDLVSQIPGALVQIVKLTVPPEKPADLCGKKSSDALNLNSN